MESFVYTSQHPSHPPTTTRMQANKTTHTMHHAAKLLGLASLASAVTVPVTDLTYTSRACRPGFDHYQFCNTSLSKGERLDSLLSLVNDTDVVNFMTARETQGLPNNVSRIGVPRYDWGGNCIHGVQSTCVNDTTTGTVYCPTSYPNPVNLGAAFNRSSWLHMGKVIGVELRALWLAGAKEASNQIHIGLDCWSPNININHDPRWGRNQEVPSEDPMINGEFGSLYTVGHQRAEQEGRYLQGITTLKHWDAYTLETSDGFTRHNFNAVVDNATLAETFFPAWKAAVSNAKAKGVMCSYNALNGIPTCASPFLKDVMRNVFEFDGYVTSDSGAVKDIYNNHKYVATPEEASCVAIKDGECDVDSGGVYHASLLQGVKDGHCTMESVHKSWRNAMGLLFDMGLFDPAENQPLWHVPVDVIGKEASQQESRQAAQESMVLLKNSGVLPLKKGGKIAVVGPHNEAQAALAGNYLGQLCPDAKFDCLENVTAAVQRVGQGNVVSAPGCDVSGTDTSGFAAALDLIDSSVDAVILAVGIDEHVSGESGDRTAISLPGVQAQFATQVLAKAGTTPVIVVLINGGMVSLGDVIPGASGIIEAFYPGYWGANAIATTLFGENAHLGGKMPYTVYPADYINEIKMSEMSMDKTGTPGRSYKYYTGPTEFEFGFGLSYTTFEFHADKPSSAPSCEDHNRGDGVSISIKNTGSVVGDNVLFLYVLGGHTGSGGLPLQKRLHNFERIHLAAGEERTVHFELNSDHFLDVEANGDHTCTPGARTIRITDGVNHQDIDVTVEGTARTAFTFPNVPPRAQH